MPRTAYRVVRVVVLEGLFDRFAYGLETGEVDHGPDELVGEDSVQQRGVTNIALDEPWPLVAERFQPIEF